MGNYIYVYFTHPDTAPNRHEPPTYDPMYGFKNGRKERVCVATWQEMEAASVPLKLRDYCAHRYIDFHRCYKKKFPWLAGCAHEEHLYHQCQQEDYDLRFKEYEREKRLKERTKRVDNYNKLYEDKAEDLAS